MTRPARSSSSPSLATGSILSVLLASTLLLAGCSGSDGSTGPQGPPGPPGDDVTDTELGVDEDAPGLHVEIVSIDGATRSDGTFQPGDHVSATFKLTKDDGSFWQLSEMSQARMMVSGPTFNYQRVLPQVSNVAAQAVDNGDGTYTYTFADPIPAVYQAPYNDTTDFGPEDGELTGQALLAGTYTLGCYFRWSYTVEGESKRLAGNGVQDFLFGGAAVIEPREVVKLENCNQCHVELQLHGGSRKDTRLCVLCHTSGAEDNTAITPGVTVDFRVMIHRIHNAEHLPSVNGVATFTSGPNTGLRDYGAPPQPYQINNEDFSHVAFPVWPNGLIAMPRDEGYSMLTDDEKGQEDEIRRGVTGCYVCHGDPDGAGPLTAPAQGDLYKAQPSRRACGSCHDDVHWGSPYTSNGMTMPSQANDSNCILCHETSGNALAVEDAHLHPLRDPAFNPGVNVEVTDLVEAGANNGNGKIDPGEKIAITFTLRDDADLDLAPGPFSMNAQILGPTSNNNLVLYSTIPTASLTGPQPFTVNVPEQVRYEFVGDATAAGGDVFLTSMPQWAPTASLTTVQVRTATSGGSSTLAAAASPPQNFIDVASAAGFAHNDYVVIDDGSPGLEEYLRINYVDGNRLWFSSPYTAAYKTGPANVHAMGATVKEVTLVTKAEGMDYTVVPGTGAITEVNEFGNGNAVLVTYTRDFVMPATYPATLNDSPDLDETWGEWSGKPIASGTYAFNAWASRTLALNLHGESNSYRSTSEGNFFEFLVGSASAIQPYELISSGDNCKACHQDLLFHGGGRRGFDTCVGCHGNAGIEDRPPYIAAAAPPTTGLTVNFRTMLHKIHKGEELAHASSYEVVGFGSGAWPNNYGTTTFEEVAFPAMPDGVKNCVKCHGNEAWHEPGPRSHPTVQNAPVREWRAVCGSCHDSDAAAAHIDLQTTVGGVESCAVCHAEGRDWNVEREHKVR